MTRTGVRLVAAYWRNDIPEGIGYEFGPHGGPTEAEIESHMEQYDTFASRDLMERQLASMAAHKHTLDEQAGIIAVLNIIWLERNGHLPSDTYNGCVWSYGRGTDPFANAQTYDSQYRVGAIKGLRRGRR